MKLTPKRKAFCDFYIESLDPARSYIKAGYNVKNIETAYSNAHRLLKNAEINTYIEAKMQEKDNERIASQDEVLELLTKFARGEEVEEVVATYKDRSEIIPKKIVPRDRLKAVELLGKRYALFTDKIEANVSQDIEIVWGDEDSDKN